ncbi:hypothetical protein [[Mycobacterium] fortunisiensis]|nr:hypothetical protein [[Mycobacterium] fortunisiensis]
MEAVARSYLMAGVALVGAGAIAVGPVQPLPPDVQVAAVPTSSVPVELNALVNPLQLWTEVFATTIDNVGTLADTVLANPAPIAGSIANNQLISAQVLTSFVTSFGSGFVESVGNVPDALQSAVEQILAGDLASGVPAIATAFLTPVLAGAFGAIVQLPDVTAVLQNPFLNAAAVVGELVSFDTLIGLGLPVLLTAISPVAQIGLTAQKIYDGIQAGDLEAVANAVISFPSDMVNTVLNGSAELGTGGILGSADDGGLAAGLLKVRQAIADAIKPPALTPAPSASVAAAPDLNARTITVDTGEIARPQAGATSRVAVAATSVAADDVAGTVVKDIAEETPAASEQNVVKKRPAVTSLRADNDTTGGERAAATPKPAKKFSDKSKKTHATKSKSQTRAKGAGGKE